MVYKHLTDIIKFTFLYNFWNFIMTWLTDKLATLTERNKEVCSLFFLPFSSC
jgi:hypothetical protein